MQSVAQKIYFCPNIIETFTYCYGVFAFVEPAIAVVIESIINKKMKACWICVVFPWKGVPVIGK